MLVGLPAGLGQCDGPEYSAVAVQLIGSVNLLRSCAVGQVHGYVGLAGLSGSGRSSWVGRFVGTDSFAGSSRSVTSSR